MVEIYGDDESTENGDCNKPSISDLILGPMRRYESNSCNLVSPVANFSPSSSTSPLTGLDLNYLHSARPPLHQFEQRLEEQIKICLGSEDALFSDFNFLNNDLDSIDQILESV